VADDGEVEPVELDGALSSFIDVEREVAVPFAGLRQVSK
jgi:hypothetical protein